MTSGKFFVVVSSLLAVAGCGTVFNAREAQLEVKDKGEGVCFDVSLPKFDLADYSLHELVDFAMTNRPSMVAAALAVVDAHLALKEIEADAPLVSGTPWNSPHVGASFGYSESSLADHRLRSKTTGNASAGLSLDILVYDFGRNRARANAQVERVVAAEYALVSEGYAVFEDVTESYFNLMAKDALLEVALTNATECALRLKQAQDRFDAGEAKRLDVTSAKLDLSQAMEATIVASNDVVTAGATMMKALGVDVTRGTRDEVFPATGNALGRVMRGFARTDYGVGPAFDLARTNAPAVAIARARLRAASHSVDRAVAEGDALHCFSVVGKGDLRAGGNDIAVVDDVAFELIGRGHLQSGAGHDGVQFFRADRLFGCGNCVCRLPQLSSVYLEGCKCASSALPAPLPAAKATCLRPWLRWALTTLTCT